MRFFVDAVRTGRVLGIDATATPDEATSALGDEYGENQVSTLAMWRDYGVVEVHWDRASAAEPWRGHHISLQTHRLGDVDDTEYDPMNANVRRAYGAFTARLRFDALYEALLLHGCAFAEVPRPDWDVLEFTYPPTAASILVCTAGSDVGKAEGDVWQIALIDPGRLRPS